MNWQNLKHKLEQPELCREIWGLSVSCAEDFGGTGLWSSEREDSQRFRDVIVAPRRFLQMYGFFGCRRWLRCLPSRPFLPGSTLRSCHPQPAQDRSTLHSLPLLKHGLGLNSKSSWDCKERMIFWGGFHEVWEEAWQEADYLRAFHCTNRQTWVASLQSLKNILRFVVRVLQRHYQLDIYDICSTASHLFVSWMHSTHHHLLLMFISISYFLFILRESM